MKRRLLFYSARVGGGISRVWRSDLNSGAWYRHGVVTTPNGYVWVYSQEDYTSYGFIWDEREYTKTEQQGRTLRGIAIMARWFAAEVIAGSVPA